MNFVNLSLTDSLVSRREGRRWGEARGREETVLASGVHSAMVGASSLVRSKAVLLF